MEIMILYSVQCSCLLDVRTLADTGISWQTEGHSFGDHLISESVSVTPSSVIEASIVLCSVCLWPVWVNVQSACALNTWYEPIYPYHYIYKIIRPFLISCNKSAETLMEVPQTCAFACEYCMYVCMHVQGAGPSALAPRPTVVYCASPSIHPLSNLALQMKRRILYVGASK
jgi:hypothetical protein